MCGASNIQMVLCEVHWFLSYSNGFLSFTTVFMCIHFIHAFTEVVSWGSRLVLVFQRDSS